MKMNDGINKETSVNPNLHFWSWNYQFNCLSISFSAYSRWWNRLQEAIYSYKFRRYRIPSQLQ